MRLRFAQRRLGLPRNGSPLHDAPDDVENTLYTAIGARNAPGRGERIVDGVRFRRYCFAMEYAAIVAPIV